MASRYITPVFDGGKGVTPADGLQLFFFLTGTSTPKDTFSDSAGTVPNANPVVSDGNGVFPDIFITGTYKVQFKDKNGVGVGFVEADPIIEAAAENLSGTDLRYGPIFDTVAAMTAANPVSIDGVVVTLVAGQSVKLQGYTTAGDVGELPYLMVASQAADERGDHTAANGTVAVLQNRGVMPSIYQFGYTGAGDDTPFIQAAIDHAIANGFKVIDLPSETTFTVTTLTNTGQVTFVSRGSTFSTATYSILDTTEQGVLVIPAAFTSWFTDNITYKNGKAETSFDIREFEITGKTYFVRPSGGADVNDGLTFATAFATIEKAFSPVDVDVVMLAAGQYDRDNAVWTTPPTRNVSMKVMGGGTADLLGSDLGVSGDYAPDVTHTNTYVRTRSSVESVFDQAFLNEKGDWLRMTLKISAAEVNLEPGSWYTDGVDVWVRLLDDRAPDDDLMVQLTTTHLFDKAVTVYAENINFYSGLGVRVTNTVGRPTLYAKNCKFKYSDVVGNLRSEGADTYLVDCESSQGKFDGLNYHNDAGNTEPARSFELRCISRDNGITGLDNNNGSTSHDANSIAIRLDCEYFENEGPNCVDVDGASSFNVGVDCRDSRSTVNSRNYEIAGGQPMYLAYCSSNGARDFDIVFSTSSQCFEYNTNLKVFSGTSTDLLQFNPFV